MFPISATLAVGLIDDDPVYRKVLGFLLRKGNFKILFEAENGAEGVMFMRETLQLPDLIILDVEMPVMDGFETAKVIKTHWPRVKIIAHSSILDPKAQNRMIESGADYFLMKNFQSMVLGEKVRQVFNEL